MYLPAEEGQHRLHRKYRGRKPFDPLACDRKRNGAGKNRPRKSRQIADRHTVARLLRASNRRHTARLFVEGSSQRKARGAYGECSREIRILMVTPCGAAVTAKLHSDGQNAISPYPCYVGDNLTYPCYVDIRF